MIQCRDTHLTQEQAVLEEGGKTPKSSKNKGASSSNSNADWQVCRQNTADTVTVLNSCNRIFNNNNNNFFIDVT